MRKVKTRKSFKKDELEDLVYYRIKNSPFKQQRLPAWRPVPTLGVIIAIYVIFGLIFIALGIVVLVFSDKIKSIEIPYDEGNKVFIQNKTIEITEDMESPIMVYYQLDGFYQNHRRYVKSRSNKQLYDKVDTTLNEMKEDGDCDPIYDNSQMNIPEYFLNSKNRTLNKTLADETKMIWLDPSEVAVPCGLMAKTYFTDSFTKWTRFDSSGNEKEISFSDKGIAWEKDLELYQNTPNISKQWLDMKEDEHFIVWMRPSGLPDFKKLYGRINTNLAKGDKLVVLIDSNYDASYYDGTKKLVLSTSNAFGGKNTFLGISFIVVGSISLVLAVAFPLINNFIMKNDKEKIN